MTYVYMASNKLEFMDRHEKFFEWKKEPPTGPGWYWVYSNGRVRLVEIDQLHGGSLEVWFAGLEYPELPEDFDWWLGPLPIPIPPEEK